MLVSTVSGHPRRANHRNHVTSGASAGDGVSCHPGIAPGHPAAAARQLALEYEDVAEVAGTDGARGLLQPLDERGIPWAVV
jgi:hypothetical protein